MLFRVRVRILSALLGKPMLVPAEGAMSTRDEASLSASEPSSVDTARKPMTVPAKPDAVPSASASFCLSTARMLEPVAEVPPPAAKRSSTNVSTTQVTSLSADSTVVHINCSRCMESEAGSDYDDDNDDNDDDNDERLCTTANALQDRTASATKLVGGACKQATLKR
jgi:hypothetical protein